MNSNSRVSFEYIFIVAFQICNGNVQLAPKQERYMYLSICVLLAILEVKRLV